MALSLAETKQELNRAAALVEQNKVQDAQKIIEDLIDFQDEKNLILASPDIRSVISTFQTKRKRELTARLEHAMRLSTDSRIETPSNIDTVHETNTRYEKQLNDLREHHIFQWSTHYRDHVGYIFRDLFNSLKGHDLWRTTLDETSELFAMHSMEIYNHGYKRLAQLGNSTEIAERKSVNGLMRFMYLLMTLYLESRESVTNAKEAKLLREIASCLIVGVLRGYGGVNFGQVSGAQMLNRSYLHWLPAFGFVTGDDASSFLLSLDSETELKAVYSTVVPTLLALDLLANRYQKNNFLLPRLSRITLDRPSRLELTLTALEHSSTRELIVTCFLDHEVTDLRAIKNALEQRSTVVVARLSASTKISADEENLNKVIDSSEIPHGDDHAHNFAEHILAAIESSTLSALAQDSTRILHNYPRDFPLNDPDFRRLFLVERNSVKTLLSQFESSTGVHLWCSVRRSGKTTSVNELAGATSSSVVLAQTMDHQPDQPEVNILEKRVREALLSEVPLAHDFFEKAVGECISSDVQAKGEVVKIILILDEYESLFGLLSAMTDQNPHLRFLVTLPLLSQMVSFSKRNLLILMGQRPNAHYILASQNQLSPLVRQHNFPLFEHYKSGSETEFSQFLRRVLFEIPFDLGFADAVYLETSGHPFLTVNLMTDLFDWLIGNRTGAETQLDAGVFESFAQARLTRAVLERSSHYSFFRSMLAEYMSAMSRKQEPWLHAVAHVLRQIGRKHIKTFSCSIASYESMAKPFGAAAGTTPDLLLTSASMSNFLKVEAGNVKPAIRLMGRLAASVYQEIN